MKKGLQEWMKELEGNKELAKKVQEMKDPKDIVKIAHENGYEITEDEIMDAVLESVSGGGFGSSMKKFFGGLIETFTPYAKKSFEVLKEVGTAAGSAAQESFKKAMKKYF